jgi:hypothetical protein
MPSPVSALNKIKNMFSPLERTIIAHKLESMPSSQWAAYIKANAPKAAKKEALAIKLDELLARQPKLSKADIVKHIQENSPKINTKNLRADGYGIDETQYGKYVLPGGEDYTETLIHLPANTSSPSIRMQKVFEIADENGQLLASGTVPMSPRTLEKLNNNPNWVVREYEQPHPADILRDPSNFSSGHFDEPNVLAHLRTNIKLTPDNKDVLFLEELQSDWAQQGRKKGFLTPDLHVERRAQIKAEMDALAKEATAMRERGESTVDIRQRMRQLDDALRDIPTPKGVPSGPYVEDTGDWTALGLKKAIERAVDEGQSHLAWTTGTQQADRYNLAKQIDSIHHNMNPDGTYSFSAVKNGQEVISKEGLTQDELAEHLGKDIAEKIVKTEGAEAPVGTSVGWEAQPSIYGDVDAPPQPRTLSGLDLQVGGEGMRTYYDQIIPSTANDILKSMGVTERVKPIGVQLGNNVSEQMGFEITPEIRDYVMNQGLPAFAGGGVVKAAAKGLREMAEQYITPKATPAVNRIDMNYKDVTKRVPELTRAANLLETGEISASEYDKLVNSLKPVTPYSFVPAPATYEDAMRALTKNKQPMYGRASEIPAGEQTDLRLDIPAYKDHGVWVNSIHRKDAPTVYDSVSSVKNATMIGAPEKALKVAKGGPKAPFAVIRGEWNPISQEDAVKQAQENLASGEWVQVGYDPERHGYFYDRGTMEPIAGAEEILQIGPLVIAKNPAYAAKAEQKFAGGGPVHMDEGGLNVRASGDYGNFDSEGSSGSHYNFSTDVDILNKYGFGVTKEGQVFKLPERTYTYEDGYTETVPARKIKRDDISELRARYMTDDGVQYGVGRQPLAKGWSAYRTDPRTQATVGFNVSPQYKNLSVYRSDPRDQSSVGVNVSPYYKGINYTKNFAEGGKVSDPFANLSMLDKAKLLAKAAKYRIQYNKQAVEHGKYPDALSSELKKNYLDTVGNSRVNRSPLDVALNYGGGYDFGVRQDVPADVARDMGKAYQYTDYFFSPFTGPKSDAVGDYYENMAGVEAGIKERGRRATEAEIQRRSAEYGKRSSKMLPQYEEPDYAEGGEVETDDFDYDEMYEFKKDEPAFAEGGEVDYDAMYEFKDNTVGFAKGGPVLSVGRGEKLPVSKGAGLTAKGRAKYNNATGSNLKAPAPHPKTDADAGRRKSFCARMSGMPGPMKDENGNPTRKAASLKRWNC